MFHFLGNHDSGKKEITFFLKPYNDVMHFQCRWKDQQINETYQELAEYYGTAIIPARVRAPKDKPNAEGTVGNISTWITATLRDEQFFSLAELNRDYEKKSVNKILL